MPIICPALNSVDVAFGLRVWCVHLFVKAQVLQQSSQQKVICIFKEGRKNKWKNVFQDVSRKGFDTMAKVSLNICVRVGRSHKRKKNSINRWCFKLTCQTQANTTSWIIGKKRNLVKKAASHIYDKPVQTPYASDLSLEFCQSGDDFKRVSFILFCFQAIIYQQEPHVHHFIWWTGSQWS